MSLQKCLALWIIILLDFKAYKIFTLWLPRHQAYSNLRRKTILQTALSSCESTVITTVIVDLTGLLSSVSRWSQYSSKLGLFLFHLVLLAFFTTGSRIVTFSSRNGNERNAVKLSGSSTVYWSWAQVWNQMWTSVESWLSFLLPVWPWASYSVNLFSNTR